MSARATHYNILRGLLVCAAYTALAERLNKLRIIGVDIRTSISISFNEISTTNPIDGDPDSRHSADAFRYATIELRQWHPPRMQIKPVKADGVDRDFSVNIVSIRRTGFWCWTIFQRIEPRVLTPTSGEISVTNTPRRVRNWSRPSDSFTAHPDHCPKGNMDRRLRNQFRNDQKKAHPLRNDYFYRRGRSNIDKRAARTIYTRGRAVNLHFRPGT